MFYFFVIVNFILLAGFTVTAEYCDGVLGKYGSVFENFQAPGKPVDSYSGIFAERRG